MLLEMVIEVLVMLLKFVMSLVIKMMRAMTMVLKQDLCSSIKPPLGFYPA